MKKILSLLVLAIGIVFLAGCSLYGSAQKNVSVTPLPTPVATQGVTTGSNTIDIQNYAFSPTPITVKKGSTVTWNNLDTAPHQIKSVTFNSEKLSYGQSFSFTFESTGTFDYSCSIHPSMSGQIIVE